MQLSKAQLKAMQAYAAERDAAIAGINEILEEAGVDPANPNLRMNWKTGEIVEVTPPELVPQPESKDSRPVRRARARKVAVAVADKEPQPEPQPEAEDSRPVRHGPRR